MNRDTIRLLLTNQEEILSALGLIAGGGTALAIQLHATVEKTREHRMRFYPLCAPVTTGPQSED